MIAADPNTSSTLQTEPQILVALGALTRRPHLVHNELEQHPWERLKSKVRISRRKLLNSSTHRVTSSPAGGIPLAEWFGA